MMLSCCALQLQDKIAACITLEQGKTFEDAKGDVMRGLRKSHVQIVVVDSYRY